MAGRQLSTLSVFFVSLGRASDKMQNTGLIRAEHHRRGREHRSQVRLEAMGDQSINAEVIGRPLARSEKAHRGKRTSVMSAKAELLGSHTDWFTDPDVPELACNDQYPLGVRNSSQCVEPHHDLIVDPEMCMQAATMTNAGVDRERFILTEEWWELHPKGCFAWPCSTSPSGMCHFFNPVGDDPCRNKTSNGCRGQPICYGALYQNGTKNGNGGCPVGYQAVATEVQCLAAASCLGFCTGAQFRIAVNNESMHHNYPEGCFIHPDEGCFYFNPPSALGKSRQPKGTPVCNATEVGHHWPNKR